MKYELPPGFALETVADEHSSSGTRLQLSAVFEEDAKPLTLSVDFLDPKILYRLTHGFGASQPLGRALGVKKSADTLQVFDATAGLGTDAFFMAALGCRVRAIERSPVVFALLQDGYRRLLEAVTAGAEERRLPLERLRVIADHLRFEHGDALSVMRGMSDGERPDVIYLDPMFPEEGRSESALPKKGMQVFRRLIGEDRDVAELLEVSRIVARQRVVLKRPLASGAVSTESASAEFLAKGIRWEMFLIGKKATATNKC